MERKNVGRKGGKMGMGMKERGKGIKGRKGEMKIKRKRREGICLLPSCSSLYRNSTDESDATGRL